MTGTRFVVIPNAVRELYVAIPVCTALCGYLAKSQFGGMYAVNVSYRSLDYARDDNVAPPVIPSLSRDLYMAIPAYIALCEHPHKSQFGGMYAVNVSYRSLAPLGMTT